MFCRCTVKGCSKRFESEESKLYHERCHTLISNEFKCFECHVVFKTWRNCSSVNCLILCVHNLIVIFVINRFFFGDSISTNTTKSTSTYSSVSSAHIKVIIFSPLCSTVARVLNAIFERKFPFLSLSQVCFFYDLIE